MINLRILDILAPALFGAMLGLRLYFSEKNTNTEKYFLGGRSLPGWAPGLSLTGNALTFVTALLASRRFKSRKTDFTNLTVWDQEKKPLI